MRQIGSRCLETPALVAGYRIGDYPGAGLRSHPWSITDTQALLLNAFDLLANWRTKKAAESLRTCKNGAHVYVEFDGPIVLDSGAFNFLRHQQISIGCKDVLNAGLSFGADVLVVLDHPFPPHATTDEIASRLSRTQANTREMFATLATLKGDVREGFRLMPVLHGHDVETLKRSLDGILAVIDNPELVGIGSLAPLAMNGNTRKAVDVILTARRMLPEAHIHVFSMGSALLMLFAFYCDADTVDSQSWMMTAAFKQVQLPGLHQTRLSRRTAERDHVRYERSRRMFADQLLRLSLNEGFQPKDWNAESAWPIDDDQAALAYLDSLEDRDGANQVHRRACHNLYAFNHEARRVRDAMRTGNLEAFVSDRITSTTYKRAFEYAVNKKAGIVHGG